MDASQSTSSLPVDSYDRCIALPRRPARPAICRPRSSRDLEGRAWSWSSPPTTASTWASGTLFGHGCSVYRPELHVPLVIVIDPATSSQTGRRVVDEPVSLRDLPSTVLERARAWATGRRFPRSITEPGAGREPITHPDDYPDLILSESRVRAARGRPQPGTVSPASLGPLISAGRPAVHHYIRDRRGPGGTCTTSRARPGRGHGTSPRVCQSRPTSSTRFRLLMPVQR